MSTSILCDPGYEDQYTVLLAIKNFTLSVNQKCISSDYFVAHTLNETKWRLQVYPRGETDEDVEYVSGLLLRANEDDGPEDITIRVTMGLIGEDNIAQKTQVIQEKTFQKNSMHGFRHFLERETLFMERATLLPQDTLTIFCRVERKWPDRRRLPLRQLSVFKKKSFRWSVEGFSNFSENEKTATVQFDTEPKTQFKMSLHVADETVNIDIRWIDKSKTKSFVVTCAITVLNSEGDETGLWRKDQHEFKTDADDVWQFPRFLKTADLNPTLLSGDILTLICDFRISTGEVETTAEEVAYPNKDSLPLYATGLTSDMEGLFVSKSHSDVEIRVAENETVSAHKFVLHFSNSPVLKKMLEDAKDISVLDIRDLNKDTLVEMLRFVYTKKLDQLMEFATLVKLFSAACNYQISALKEECSSLLESSLTVRNACEVLVVAHTHSDRMLLEEVVDFISENWTRFSLSDEWENLILTRTDMARETRLSLRKKILNC